MRLTTCKWAHKYNHRIAVLFPIRILLSSGSIALVFLNELVDLRAPMSYIKVHADWNHIEWHIAFWKNFDNGYTSTFNPTIKCRFNTSSGVCHFETRFTHVLIKVRPDSSFVAVDVSRRKPANDAKCRGFDLTNIWNFLEAVPGVEDQRCLNKVAQYSRANRADFIGQTWLDAK